MEAETSAIFDAKIKEALIEHFGAAPDFELHNIKRELNFVFSAEVEDH